MSRRSEWELTRLKYVADCNAKSLPEDTDPEHSFAYVDISNVTQGSVNTNVEVLRFADAPSRARRLAKPGDTIVSTVRTYLRAVATVPVADQPLVFSTGFAVLSPRPDVHPRFLSYYLQGDEFVDRVVASSVGVSYPAITATELMRFSVVMPSLSEQRAIADHLDRETGKVDALIAEQQSLVRVLRERRSAVITRAATHGIRGARLVPTGDAYFTEAPEHWRVSRFGREMVVNAGQVDPRDEPWADMILVAPNHIQSGTGRIVGRETAREQGADSGKYLARANQILYSKIRPALDKVTVAVEDCLCSADMYAMTSRTPGDPRFSMYFMLSRPFHTYATLQSLRVKMPKVNRDELGAAPWPIPPLPEQVEIADYLDEQTAKIDALIAEAEGIATVAKERRSALITAAVTGQIDVRGAVA